MARHHRGWRHRRHRPRRRRPGHSWRAGLRAGDDDVRDHGWQRQLPSHGATSRGVPPADPVRRGLASGQRRRGRARRSGWSRRHRPASADDGGADGGGHRAGISYAGSRSQLQLSGRAARCAEERGCVAGRLALRARTAGRGHWRRRLPQRHHRARRQPTRESFHRRQRRGAEHQHLCQFHLRRRHGEHSRCATPAGRDVPDRRLSRAVRQSHVECAADHPARRQPRGVRRARHGRVRRRWPGARGADQQRPRVVGGVGPPQFSRPLHQGRRHRRRAGALHVQRQSDLRPVAARSGVAGQSVGRRRDSARPQRRQRSRRGALELRHPLRRLAIGDRLQLAAPVRHAWRRSARRHIFPGQCRAASQGSGARRRAGAGHALECRDCR